MSDDVLEAARQAVGDYLLAEYRGNRLRRAVEMDKVVVLSRGEEVYCTRFMVNGRALHDEELGYQKGMAKAGMVVRITPRHVVGYASLQVFLQEAGNMGYRLTAAQKTCLERGDAVYLTNGLDDRLPWMAEATGALLRLAQDARMVSCDRLHGVDHPIAEGDWICGFERSEGKGLCIAHVRSRAYGDERFRFLDALA